MMTDYAEINRRLIAQRRAAEESEDDRKRRITGEAEAVYSEILRLAAEFHHVWELKGFPDGAIIETPHGEMIARNIGSYYNDPDDYRHVNLYVMIDGQLVWYIKSHYGTGRAGLMTPRDEVTFKTYREYIYGRGLYSAAVELEGHLRYIRDDLEELHHS